MSSDVDSAVETVTSGIVDQNVDAIMAMQSADLQALTRHQRTVERMVVFITYPEFLFGVALGIVGWIGVNFGMQFSGRTPLDTPPFGWLQTGVGVLALLMTSIIVITQSRQGKAAERHAHLELQINLIVDQKVAKVIQLLEEMRTDSPILKNRRDELAEEMQVAVDPTHIASVITEKMSQIDVVVEVSSIEPTEDELDDSS